MSVANVTPSAWEDYWRVGPASDTEIAEAERKLGVCFPRDFKELLTHHQGMIPLPRWIDLFGAPPKTKFGPLMHVSTKRDGGRIVTTIDRLRAGGYPALLVPFADSGSQTHFALDYRSGSDVPAVVFVTLEFDYDDPDFTVLVASTISELIGRLETED